MNHSLLEKILVESIGLSPSEREVLAQRLQHMPPADQGFPPPPFDMPPPPEAPEPLPDAHELFGGER